MVKRENAITVDIIKAIFIRNYIKLGEHVKKIEMKIFMAGSSSTRLKENTARLDSNILRLSFCGFGCDSQVYILSHTILDIKRFTMNAIPGHTSNIICA